MKKQLMKSPVISQLYTQKLIHSAHLKKLQSIKNHRKTQLSIDKSRTIMIDKIRRNKAFTFASSFNNEYDQINRKNQSILKKIATIKPSTACEVKRYSNRSNEGKRMNSSRISLKEIQKQRQVSKQNQRLYVKLKTMESNLKKEKFKYMHEQTQRIKQRIMRYSQDMDRNGKITLKSQQFVSLPKTNHLSRQHRLKEMNQTTKTSDLNHSRRSTIAQHYKKEQIQNNTLENIHKRYSTINALSPHKSSTSKKFSARKYEQNEEERTFLTVQQQQRKTLKINEVQQSSQRNRISFAKNNLEKLKMLDNQKPVQKKN